MSSGIVAGTRLGPYEIVSKIGAGGMGEVWKATDTRLDRSVAIKVLSSELSADAQFRTRFEREAKTISQLNHPHICVVHDVGHSATADAAPLNYLVMELLDGETLAERLLRGPLPVEQVLRIGAQIAEALDAAHRNGVIHRDLKPANVMLTKAGAKLLDFGLAKAAQIAPWGGGHSATIARNGGPDSRPEDGTHARSLTAEGTIVGTFQYMAPEQLEGLPADARTDIFALGAVLYEMATGRRAFDGATKTSIIAAIVDRDPPPIRQFQPLTPPAFEHVVARCLAKSPSDRWQSAHDIAQELSWIREAGSQAGVAAPLVRRKRSRERLAWALVAMLGLALIAVTATLVPRLRRANRPFVADIAPPRGARFNAVGDEAGPLVLSPDGTLAVYSSADKSGNHLMLRSLLTGEIKVLERTEGGQFPFWSPDSRKIGFFTIKELERVDVSGGSPVPICRVINARGGTWGPDDTIVFAAATQDPLSKVAASGGIPIAVTKLDVAQHSSHRWPSFLPDGKRFLYLACNHEDPGGSVNAVYLGSLDGAAPRLILRSVSNAIYAGGYLLFDRDQTLYAQKVKSDLSLEGEPVSLAHDVLYDAGIWRGAFSVSNDGLLAYHSGRASVLSKLLWLDRHGALLETVGEKGAYWDVELSPNQQKVLLPIGDPQRDLWVQDLVHKTRTKLTLNGWANTPAWSPDGTTIYVDMLRRGNVELVSKRITGAERVLSRRKTFFAPRAVSPDGKIVFLETTGMIEQLPLDAPDKAVPLTRAGSIARGPSLSPDGKWLAYSSNENGRGEVFVVSLAQPELKWQVSANGGTQPRWRGDGKELYFLDLTSHINAVPIVENGSGLDFAPPQELFAVTLRPTGRTYDVAADGQKFLVNALADEDSPTVMLVSNWKTLLPR